jgi:hypothetical protein
MRARARFSTAVLGLLSLLLTGCPPTIGDDCQTSADCSAQENRLCDTTQPGGYCTVFNCEPGACSDEGVCVAFSAALSVVPGCNNPNAFSRFERSFCMSNCESDDDCRSGYICADMRDPNNPWAAVVVDEGSGKVCAVPMSGAPIPPDRSNEVCTGTDAGFEGPDAGTSAGGAGGEAGGGGAGGEAGAEGGAGGSDGGDGGGGVGGV